jgi:hypothetical protein
MLFGPQPGMPKQHEKSAPCHEDGSAENWASGGFPQAFDTV